ncbi:MAG TPA: IS1595 family transposase [Terriglobia bacterium]|nr:IS1595 family transposase [Terriglobia bacterium]
MNLVEVAKQKSLSTEEKCIAYLERMRWPEGVRCPACGHDSVSRFETKARNGKKRRLYQCLDKTCRYQFSPTTGTIFHDSHLPLTKWFSAIALVCESKEPMSINQLRLKLGVQYKTASHLASRIRQAMERGSIELSATRTDALPSKTTATKPPAPGAILASRSLDERRAETKQLLNQIVGVPGSGSVSSTTVDNLLGMFVSLAQMSVRPPLFFVNYLRNKVFT